MAGGVGKSGSPAPKPTTSTPSDCSCLAFASMAKVADGATPPTRRETRRGADERSDGDDVAICICWHMYPTAIPQVPRVVPRQSGHVPGFSDPHTLWRLPWPNL